MLLDLKPIVQEAVKAIPGGSVRDLRKHIAFHHPGVTKKTINPILYAGEKAGIFMKNEDTQPKWSPAPECDTHV